MATNRTELKTEGTPTTETPTTEPKEKKLTKFLKRLIIVTCLGSAQCGFNLWIVSDPTTLKKQVDVFEGENDTLINPLDEMHPVLMFFTLVSFLLGCLIGSIMFGPMADKYGRKGILLATDIFSMIASVTMAITQYFAAHFLRAWALFLTGLCTGMFFCAVPLYLGEVSSTNLRGSLVCLHMMFVSIGMLLSQLLGAPHFLGGSATGAPIHMSFPAMMALCQLFLLPRFPESPRYILIQKQDVEGARKALQKLRGKDDVEKEIEELREEDAYEKKEKGMFILKLLCFPTQRWHLTCGIMLFAAQQFSGVNIIYFYADAIFLGMNLGKKNVVYISVVLTLLVLFSHGFSVYRIDTLGRRPLLLGGLIVCTICSVLLTVIIELQVIIPQLVYVSCILVVVFLLAIAIGPNSIPYLMTVELFLQSSRASALAILGFFQWFLLFILEFLFILTERYIRNFSFLLLLPLSIVSIIYIYKFVPETKNKMILDVRKLLEPFLAERYLRKTFVPKTKKWEKN